MTTEIILSPVKDQKFNTNISTSEVWKKAYKPEEVTEEVKAKFPNWYQYHIKFDGLKPVQMTKFSEMR